MSTNAYRPTAGDLRFDQRAREGANDFDEALLLRGVSPEYLSVMLSDHTGDQSKPFKAMLDAADVIQKLNAASVSS